MHTRPKYRALRIAAWALLIPLLGLWVVELGYCLQLYYSGGWASVWGYLQGTVQGYEDIFGPVSTSAVVIGHLVILGATLLASAVLWKTRSRTA